MPSFDTLLADAVTAVEDGSDVDIVGPRMSGRSSLVRHLGAHFRDAGWQVVDARVADPARFGEARILILADDWDYLDDEMWSVAQSAGRDHGAVLVVTRHGSQGGWPPFPSGNGHVVAEVPTLDGGQLRVLVTRVFGFILDQPAADSLARVSGGAVGVAIGLVNAARESGALVVGGASAELSDGAGWLDAAAPVVASLVGPLSDSHRDAMARVGALGRLTNTGPVPRSAAEAAAGDGMLAELTDLGFVVSLPDQAVALASPLLAAYFGRAG